MNVQLLEEELFFENTEVGLQQLIERINRTLGEKNTNYSHIVVDGEEVYEDPVEYISSNIDKIKEIIVRVKTIQQFINDLIVSLNQYTQRAIPEIEALIDQFYQNPSSDTWSVLEQLLEGIEWIYNTIKNIDQTSENQYKWNEYLKAAATFEGELPNLMDALENTDAVVIADIIQYEILPQFQVIHETTEEAFNRE